MSGLWHDEVEFTNMYGLQHDEVHYGLQHDEVHVWTVT